MSRYAKFARVLTLSVAIGLLPTLAACSSDSDEGASTSKTSTTSQSDTGTGTTTSTDSGNSGELWNQKFDPPVTITTAIMDDGTSRGNAFKPGESMEDNANIRWMKDNMGINVKFDFIVTKPEDYDTKLRLLLSSGGKLPDAFAASNDPLQSLLSANKLMPLDEAIEKYAHPEYKKLLEKYSYALGEVKKDGKIYGLPAFFMGDEGTVMWIRKDWLDNLGLQPPKTLDDFENVLKAFTENDPDKNGKNDTIGLAVPLKEGPWTWMGQTDAIVSALTDQMINTYDVRLFWNKGADGKLSYGAIHPDAKLYLEKMRDWMSKGYLDKEAGIKDPSKSSELAASGKAGIMFGPFWMGEWPLGDATKNDPKADFEPYPLPTGPTGLVGRAEKPLTQGFTVFSKDFQHIDAWFAYFNKIFAKKLEQAGDPYFDPRWKDGYLEGYDYVKYNGKVVKGNYEAAGVPAEQWPLKDGGTLDIRYMMTNILGNFTSIPGSNVDAVKKFLADPNAEATSSLEFDVSQMKKRQLDAAGVRINQQVNEGKNYFTGPMTATMKSKGELLKKLATESYLKIIYGEKPIEYFDQFVKQWLDNGGQKITDEVNEWYAKNQ
ncbi:putative aldouronate transport system substrate-binding protein [Paenibacillus cellulosilyticus]|uniref:Putative aldouronate transport system substrate-binding protein n=1 Tax=Paenibacillus cellulosilyticus TaxID=375489 RepID=A0A2V2YQE5_9BACL|nr:extracellular solute-binding protein [Paenibacillus cellulosilyticus]PWV98498.1 putative aldouronate transport system substrate-binding protein [Paenibacillus cellulosilyticus]QKS44107.1 extracellular solute-binding protein [Paenibacillus cellulosilyticus]